eukprot:1118181_1
MAMQDMSTRVRKYVTGFKDIDVAQSLINHVHNNLSINDAPYTPNQHSRCHMISAIGLISFIDGAFTEQLQLTPEMTEAECELYYKQKCVLLMVEV